MLRRAPRKNQSVSRIFEVDVHPDHGRRGVGTRLMRAVEDWARAKGFAAATLTTFRHLPWNAPFYARLGYREIPEAELTAGLRSQLDQEAGHGLERSKRVAMRLTLGPG
jgi:GNAT superfamily N-acetyltransferase